MGYKDNQKQRIHRLWWQSSYDRGLDILLFLWPDIKAKFPDAELWVTYGWNLFDKVASTNPERMRWKQVVEGLMNQPGVKHFGRVGQGELKKLRKQCGILAYPTYFTEISCIGALESQQDGLVPVTMTLAALDETVQSGIKVKGDIKNPQVQEEYLEQLLSLMADPDRWQKESLKAQNWAKSFAWSEIASSWVKEFKQP